MIMMKEHLEYVLEITEALNSTSETPEGMYLRVQLVQDDSRVLGQWCDEHGPESWYFDSSPEVKS